MTTRSERIREQYETWPYPQFPRFAAVRRLDTWQLNLDYLRDRCGFGAAPKRPRIWIAGCGTFQPYTLGLANPGAEVVATDISLRSLRQARQRCLWHGLGRHRFVQVDLNDPATWPDGQFDWIECYGVLMNLEDPAAALARMAERLTDEGILRLMVYPHFSRQRIFQVQRVARLLGLHAGERAHPQALRSLVQQLPEGHPLRYAFTTYPDSANPAGIVDGFLHAGDRGFSAPELGEMCTAADLEPGFWFHRPWGDPTAMRNALGLGPVSDWQVLDYLDRWQELRTNLILCLRKRRGATPSPDSVELRLHPLLETGTRGLPLPGRLGIWWQRTRGLTLRSRTHATPPRWTRDELAAVRRVVRGAPRTAEQTALLARALCDGVVLTNNHAPVSPPSTRVPLHDPDHKALQVGDRVANPLFQHLFAAWYAAPDIDVEIARWRDHADPLERDPMAFGLTPFATFLRQEPAVREHLRNRPAGRAGSFAELRYAGETVGIAAVRALIERVAGLPYRDLDAAEWRELWVLLGTHRQLLLDAVQA
ncbi:MAG: class I SAM-dependent methyltransferase [Planctomycetes bacterium]|nr:class I SAM-dependent methyltransferase [Planctomycetota bacterium]